MSESKGMAENEAQRVAEDAPSSHWNRRLVRRIVYHNKPGVVHAEVWYAVHEVYYSQGNPTGITKEPCAPWGETRDELREELQRYLAALDSPCLDYDTMEEIAE